MRIRAPKDFWAGLMFIAFGISFAAVAQNYQMGSAVRMGPAYFPTMLGGILAVIGLVILLGSLVVDGPKVPRFYFRPIIFVVVAIVLFGFLLKPAGLVLALFALIAVSAVPGFEWTRKDFMLLPVYLIGALAGVFVALWIAPSIRTFVVAAIAAIGWKPPDLLTLVLVELAEAFALAFFASKVKWPGQTASIIAISVMLLTISSVAIFVQGLGLPMPVWPGE
jgi:hypothetical protein